jgi:hypothetical protein
MDSAPQTKLRGLIAGVLAALGWFGLILQLYVSIATAHANGTSVATAIVNYFSFFTILTNLLVAMVLTQLSLHKRSRDPFFTRPAVQATAAVSIAIVGIVYSLVLRQLWDPEGLQKIADIILHDAIPVLYVVYWLWLARSYDLRFRDVPRWLIYPAVYLIYTLIRGAITGRYPYPFLDAGELGYPRVCLNIIALLGAFLTVGLGLLAVNHWVQRRRDRP